MPPRNGSKYLLEICANSYQSAKNAQDGGADRVELCQNLEQGGITPSYGLIKRCVDTLTIPVHVLIRPRPGNFVYTDDEFQIMLEDISMCRQLGVAGVVIGLLHPHNAVDFVRVAQMVEAASPLHVTFHRAIEDCPDQIEALETIILSGCQRVLTSGAGADNFGTLDNLRNLIGQAGGRIEIMVGGGVTCANITNIVNTTRATSYHASAKSIKIRATDVDYSRFDVEEMESDVQIIRELVEKMRDTPGPSRNS